ncbi:ClpA/B family protein [Plesiocystis pacifica SIR-1]|uniref:ClpA/B family protein n=1 Tax=Plesiocystis pacifica SIR-1 TaxID=391625 RepID=A6GDL5_9BACT|nr:AAA family ATPase [Plesiocystis pacifica]EDM76058.1 ClpA/B family protein [Plesiocystis pacifica SIR-1]
MPEPLELEVLLVVESLPSGDFQAWPFANPGAVAHGATRESVLEQQELYLRELLSRIEATKLAAYSPAGELEHVVVEVPVARAELPDRVRMRGTLPFPCLRVAEREGWWAAVLNLGHFAWVPRPPRDADADEDQSEAQRAAALDEHLRGVIARDIERVLAARSLSSYDYLQLLRGGNPYSLERLRVELEREEQSDPKARAQARRRRARDRSQAEARKLLSSVGTSVLAEVRRRRTVPILHREREIASLDALLRGPERLALALVGPELSGKTAVVLGLAQRWLELERPARERLPVIVQTSGAQLVAGQSGFGQLEQRVQDVMAAAEALDAVLYFDNLADLFARTSGELGDVAASIRPWIERGRVRLLGELTPERLEHHEKRHVGFFSVLNRLPVHALDAPQTRAILEAQARYDRRYEPKRPTLTLGPASPSASARMGRGKGGAAQPLVDLAERYFSYQAFPGKAMRFYQSLRATQETELDAEGKPRPISPDVVYKGFSLHSGIPMFLLREDRGLEFARVVEYFGARVIGQRAAIDRVAETLCTVKAGLQPAAKPLATFLFVGPTGVGKTEVAKTLARFLFGSPERMTRFDMSEYMDPLAADRLIRGTDREDGVLTRRVRQQPFCVLLLDEVEKAHPAVFDLLLQVCGEGRLSDARGRTTWFHNAIIIMTSNLGAAHRRPQSGFGGGSSDADPKRAEAEAERYYLEQVDTHFRPEFVNRIDRIIPFHPLDRAQIQAVARVSLTSVREREGLAERGVSLELEDGTLARLAEQGYSSTYGARALRRVLEDRLVAPMARTLARLGGQGQGASVWVGEAPAAGDAPDADAGTTPPAAPGLRSVARETQDALHIQVSAPTSRSSRKTTDALARVAQLRRSARASLELPPIRALVERERTLVAELGYGTHRRRNDRSPWEHAAELGRLQAELGRIAGTVRNLDSHCGSIESAEELTIAALYEGEDAALFVEAAEDSHAELRKGIVDALLLANERHAITVHLQEQDSRGAFAIYLLPLLDALAERGWRVQAHVYGDRSGPDGPGDKAAAKWPTDRKWGPPRTPHWLRRELRADLEAVAGDSSRIGKRRWRNLLLRVQGRHAGAIFSSQLGLVQFSPRHVHPSKDKGAPKTKAKDRERDKDSARSAHMLVRHILHTDTVTSWGIDALSVDKALRRDELEATPRRLHFTEAGRVTGSLCPWGMALLPEDLWASVDELLFTPLVEAAHRGEELS